MLSTNEVYNKLRNEIVRGQLNPGEHLVENELCMRLGASRGYVREALKRLTTDGFVVISHGKGAKVNKISYQEMKDLYEILAVLETKSVELAAPHLTTTDLNRLRSINKKMRSCINDKDVVKTRKVWQESNFQFHRIFADKSGNRELQELVESVRWRTFDFRFVYFFERYYNLFVEQHESLISAIHTKNFRKAKKIMNDHVTKASKIVLEMMGKKID